MAQEWRPLIGGPQGAGFRVCLLVAGSLAACASRNSGHAVSGVDTLTTTSGSTSTWTTVSSGADGSSTGTIHPPSLCAEGVLQSWCFEVRPLAPVHLIGDLDKDGLDDAVTWRQGSDLLDVAVGMRNVGDAVFEELWSIDTGFGTSFGRPSGSVDEHLKFFVGAASGPDASDTPLRVFDLSVEAATLSASIPIEHTWFFGDADFLDANEDGRMDIVIGAHASPRLLVLLGNDAGGYDPMPEIHTEEPVGADPGMVVGDIDGDGHTDLVMSTQNLDLTGPTVFFGDGDGNFAEFARPAIGDGYWPLELIDLDDDGDDDILAMDRDGFLVIYSEPGRQFRTVEQGRIPGESGFSGLHYVAVDLDRDGGIEVVGLRETTASAQGQAFHGEAYLEVYSQLGSDGFADRARVLFEDTCDAAPEEFRSDRRGELDGDGNPDIVLHWSTACPEPLTFTVLGFLYRPDGN